MTDKPFAMNLWVSNHDEALATFDQAAFTAHLAPLLPLFVALNIDPPTYPERFGYSFAEQIEALLEARPPVFSWIYGVPPGEVIAAWPSSSLNNGQSTLGNGAQCRTQLRRLAHHQRTFEQQQLRCKPLQVFILPAQ